MRKSARTQIPPFFDNDPYIHIIELTQLYITIGARRVTGYKN